MNREDIIRWAREAGMRDYCDSWTVEDDPTRKQPKQIHTNDLASFAALVAAAEREACAKVVDSAASDDKDWDTNDWNQAVQFCASRVRARGNT